MKQQVSFRQFRDRLCNDCSDHIDRYVFAENGAIYPKGPFQYMISPEMACREAYYVAVAYHYSGNETLREKAQLFLDYAGNSLIRQGGYVYWPAPVASLCSMGRWAREAFRAAQLLQYKPAMIWLDELFSGWPFDYEQHRFVERFMETTHYPTSVYGFLSTYNMIAEGVADSWLVAEETGNQNLKEKARDVIVNFILPGQRPDGIWNYSAPKSVDMGKLNDGEKEYNYCLYLVYVLSNLLECTEARDLLRKPLQRAMDALLDRFLNPDGSIYAPVHWGWDHIWESTLLTSVICWRLYHYCGLEQYEALAARGIHWLMLADLGCGNLADGMSCVGLYWNALFLDMLKDDFSVSGNLCGEEEVISTLEMVEKKLAILPPDETHLALFFSLQVYATRYALQRKIMRLKRKTDDTVSIPSLPQRETIPMPWKFDDTCCSGLAMMGYDSNGLEIVVECDSKMDHQPYAEASLFQGDGVFLTLQDMTGKQVLVNLAVQDGKPVVFLYNCAIPFRGDLRLYVESEPRGWYLQDSLLTVVETENGVKYCAKLNWKELGISAQKGCCLVGGIAITRFTPYGIQFNQIGRTALENKDFSYQAHFTLV